MASGYAILSIWLIGMFGIIGTLIALLVNFMKQDSWSYDERFIWFRKIRE
ncbi:hypothetical protein RB620_15775 [Paenibacillus sp. LHD-117]|nr:hypothetical protein [Paenibacillus sp. LHD-117]MDQ6420890.1 hypothetical protein [Paenibacillus sp. LHD-117]